MGNLNFNLEKSTTPKLSAFDKEVSGANTKTARRPTDGFITNSQEINGVRSVRGIGDKFISLHDLDLLAKNSDLLQIIFNTRARKTFQKGFDIDPIEENAESDNLEDIEKWQRRINNNNQSLKEVLTQLDKDLNTFDDAYLLALKDYGYNANGEINFAETKEFIRLDPISVNKVLDKALRLGRTEYGNDSISRPVYFNPEQREALTTDNYDKKTGRRNLQAHYKVWTSDGVIYYNDSEVMHKSSFNPSLAYGYSPLFSGHLKLLILILQDIYIKKYYGEDKPLKGLLVFNTQDKQGLMKTFTELRAQVKKNPHSVKPIVAESDDGRKPVEYIDMAKTMDEMQFSDNRQEIRQQIGAIYGVSPMFQNDMSQGGGLNNEGLQVTVTNEVISDRQELFNNSFLRFIFTDNLGFNGWSVKCVPNVELDEMADAQLEAQQLANVKLKLELGLSGKLDENGQYIFEAGGLELDNSTASFSPFGLSYDETNDQDNDLGKVEKAARVPKAAKTFNNKLQAELSKVIGDLNLNKKLSKKDLLKKIDKINKKLSKKLKTVSSSVFKGIYEKSARDTNKILNEGFTFGDRDKNVLEALKQDTMYQKSFANLSAGLSDRVRKSISSAYGKKEFSINNMMKQINEDLDVAQSDLRRIVRTESSKISLASRKTQLDKTDAEYVYKHKGAKDNRTGKDSLELMELTKNGVSWEEYLNLVIQVAKKYNSKWKVNKTAPLLHPNQRSLFLFERAL